MGIVSINEIHDSRRGERELEKAKRAYVRSFRVVTDSHLDGPAAVVNAPGIPTVGTQYITASESDLGAILKNKESNQSSEDPLVWTVSCNYDSETPDPADAEENPLARPIKWKFSFQKESQAVHQDLDGRGVVNSAGQPFLPPTEISVTRPLITAEKNQSSFSFSFVSGVVDCVNSVAWNGFPIGTVKIDSVEASSEFENNVGFWKLNWTFSVNWEGWIPTKILDAGFYEVIPPGSSSSYFSSYVPGEIDSSGWAVTGTQAQLRQIRDAFGTPVNAPQLLCGGRALPPEARNFPCYRFFRFYRWHNFVGIP
jgi:hypothetical protein